MAFAALAATTALADPPDEDVLRPRVAGSGPWFIHAGIGVNISQMDGNPYLRPLFNYEGRTTLFEGAYGAGILVSLGLGYQATDNLALLLRLDYDQKSTGASEQVVDTCFIRDQLSGQVVNTPVNTDKQYEFDVNYVSISILPEYRFRELHLFAGPTIAFPLSRRLNETDRILDTATPCNYFPGTADSSRVRSGSAPSDRNMKTRFSFKFGIGYEIGIAPNVSVVPQIALDLGLNSALDLDETTGTFEEVTLRNPARPASVGENIRINDQVRLNSLQASVGLRLMF